MTSARRIRIDQVMIGDLINVTYDYHDVQVTRKGRVAKKDLANSETAYMTHSGIELIRKFKSGHMQPSGAKITLLDRLDTQPELIGFPNG